MIKRESKERENDETFQVINLIIIIIIISISIHR